MLAWYIAWLTEGRQPVPGEIGTFHNFHAESEDVTPNKDMRAKGSSVR